MVYIPFIVLAAITIVWIEVPRMRRKRLKRELWAFSFLLALGVFLCAAKAAGAQLPSPVIFLSYVFKPMGVILQKMIS